MHARRRRSEVCLALSAVILLNAAAGQVLDGLQMDGEMLAPFQAMAPASKEKASSGSGPNITHVTQNPQPQPVAGADIPITATVPNATSGDTVTLVYLVNYGPEIRLPMTEGAQGQFSASIPSAAFAPSDMVRWYVMADSVRSPPLGGKSDQYFGTVIADPTVSYTIPVMEWFTSDPDGSASVTGANGSSIYYLGRFYNNIFVRRKGVTSLSWPKPKLKFKLGCSDFIYKQTLNKSANESKVSKFNLNSLYYEPGQKSYMREAIAYAVLANEGAISAINYHLVVRQNGAFYGLHTYTEDDDKFYLERNGLSSKGVLIKPTSGSDGNLGFNVSENQLQYYYNQQNHAKKGDYFPQLYSFTQGIAGGGNEVRSLYVFDAVELSETINSMAIVTMLLTQDRCTKNYLLYLDLNTSMWQMFYYDLKSALNADAGYGGVPAPDYCTLECSQWNSPLYCDRGHPQDIPGNATSPWTFISASNLNSGRRLKQVAPGPSLFSQSEGPSALDLGGSFPAPSPSGPNVNITNPNENLVAEGNFPQGAAGTFNYLVDLITQVPATRQMYMRRMRTLTDKYYNGLLIQMITDMYNQIKVAANQDNEKWDIGNITLGYWQLVQDQIPTRKTQLLSQYGPNGNPALLPASQPANVPLLFGRMDSTSAAQQQFVEIVNNNSYAVDVSDWVVNGTVSITLKPGTVIALGNSLILAADVVGFRQRTQAPTVGQGFQVLGPYQGSLGPSSGSLTLTDDTGVVITSSPASAPPSAAG